MDSGLRQNDDIRRKRCGIETQEIERWGMWRFFAEFAAPTYSDQITYADDSYTSGDTLTAADLNVKFNEIKADVNDNNTGDLDLIVGSLSFNQIWLNDF